MLIGWKEKPVPYLSSQLSRHSPSDNGEASCLFEIKKELIKFCGRLIETQVTVIFHHPRGKALCCP